MEHQERTKMIRLNQISANTSFAREIFKWFNSLGVILLIICKNSKTLYKSYCTCSILHALFGHVIINTENLLLNYQ